MPFDALFLTAVRRELEGSLTGCRVDKVQQPQRDTLILSMRGAAGGVHSRLSTRTALQCMSASTAGIIESYMIETVESGTATRAAVDGHTIAGKTGTAQVNSSGGRYSPHSWYVGYCAEEETPYAIAVVVENGGSGGSAAARLAGRVMERAIETVQPAGR